MRLLKTLYLVAIGIGLIVLGLGNMGPVDLFLLPEKVAGESYALRGIPLAAVILASVMLGLVIGQVLEWLREGKHRRMSNDRGREVTRLREELSKVKRRIADPDDDLPKLPTR